MSRMPKNQKKRMQLSVSKEFDEVLKARAKSKGYPTVAELIRRDLYKASEVDRLLAEGYQIIKEEEDGKKTIAQFID